MSAAPGSGVGRDAASAPFFDAAGRGTLLIRRCATCPRFLAPQLVTCPHCGCTPLEWVEAGGSGHLETWTAAHERGQIDGPTVIALVELDEGPWLMVRVLSSAEDDLEVGRRVDVRFERIDGGEPLPVVRLG